MNYIKLTLIAMLVTQVFATDRIGRLGLGFTNQLQNNTPSISFKLQRSKSFAFGGFFGLDTGDDGGWDAGIKLYRVIFDEPQLTFYSHFLGALINEKSDGIKDESGFQFDVGMGSEFSFRGLESLGFSVEFGFSLYKVDEFVIQTVGSNFVIGSVHFYL